MSSGPTRSRAGWAVALAASVVIHVTLLAAPLLDLRPWIALGRAPEAAPRAIYRAAPPAVEPLDRATESAARRPRQITIERRRVMPPRRPPDNAPGWRGGGGGRVISPDLLNRRGPAPAVPLPEPLASTSLVGPGGTALVPVSLGWVVALVLPEPGTALATSLAGQDGPVVVAMAETLAPTALPGRGWVPLAADDPLWRSEPQAGRWLRAHPAAMPWRRDGPAGPALWLPLPVRAGWEARSEGALALWRAIAADRTWWRPDAAAAL